MPIVIKDFSWQQTDETVFLRVPLRGIPTSKVDIFTSENYIKVHFAPFLCELFLAYKINETNSKCTLQDGEAQFELKKEIPEHWDVVEADIPKSEKMKIKEQIILDVQNKTVQAIEERTKRRSELQRLAVNRQMAQDTEVRETIDTIKADTKTKVMAEFEEWKQTNNKAKITEIIDDEETCSEMPKKIITIKKKKKRRPSVPVIKPSEPENQLKPVEHPEPRQQVRISVEFSKRHFPTPSRDIAAEMENEWLKKQVEAQRVTGFTEEDLKPEEMDPAWLKGKGDTFFAAKNYKAAINAYTTGIKLANKMPSLYANRAAAQYNIGNYHRCIEDCTAAIDNLQPPCESNRTARAGCIARRGAALCQVGHLAIGIEEMNMALKLTPDNKELQADIAAATKKYTKQDGSSDED